MAPAGLQVSPTGFPRCAPVFPGVSPGVSNVGRAARVSNSHLYQTVQCHYQQTNSPRFVVYRLGDLPHVVLYVQDCGQPRGHPWSSGVPSSAWPVSSLQHQRPAGQHPDCQLAHKSTPGLPYGHEVRLRGATPERVVPVHGRGTYRAACRPRHRYRRKLSLRVMPMLPSASSNSAKLDATAATRCRAVHRPSTAQKLRGVGASREVSASSARGIMPLRLPAQQRHCAHLCPVRHTQAYLLAYTIYRWIGR